MNSNEAWARRRLPVKFKIAVQTRIYRRRHPYEFISFQNLLYNVFGPPAIRMDLSRYSTDMYWKKYHDGVWARIGNEFMFADEKTAQIARRYLPWEFEILKK